jgi:hypothetical protein
VKRKGFKTSPEMRIPRAAVKRLEETKAQAQAQAQEITCLGSALRDLMSFFDKLQGSSGSWTVAEVKRIAAIRRLVRGA